MRPDAIIRAHMPSRFDSAQWVGSDYPRIVVSTSRRRPVCMKNLHQDRLTGLKAIAGNMSDLIRLVIFAVSPKRGPRRLRCGLRGRTWLLYRGQRTPEPLDVS